jgi:predicted PurR-regulated permease PerM
LSGDGREHRFPPLGYIASAAAVVIGLWALANVVWLGRDLFFIAFLSVLFGRFLNVCARPLRALRVPHVLAVPIAFVMWLGLLSGLVALAMPVLRDQVELLRDQLPQAISKLLATLQSMVAGVTSELGEPPTDLMSELGSEAGRLTRGLISGALPVLGSVVGALGAVVVIAFGGLYLAIESRLFLTGTLALMPVSVRARVSDALTAAGRNLERWIMGTGLTMVLVGLLTGSGLLLLDIPSAFALAIIAGLFEFVPFAGPILASLPALALSLAISPVKALWVLLLYVVVQQLESNVISPLVMKGVVRLPPALVLLFQLLMTILFGFIGLLVAVPMLAVIIVCVRRLYVEPLESSHRPAIDLER